MAEKRAYNKGIGDEKNTKLLIKIINAGYGFYTYLFITF